MRNSLLQSDVIKKIIRISVFSLTNIYVRCYNNRRVRQKRLSHKNFYKSGGVRK